MSWADVERAIVGPFGERNWKSLRDSLGADSGALGLIRAWPDHRFPIALAEASPVLDAILTSWDYGLVPGLINPRWPEAKRVQIAGQISPKCPVVEFNGRPVLEIFIVGYGESFGPDDLSNAERYRKTRINAPFFSRDDDVEAVIVFTSGSTGEPRAALLTFRNLHAAASAANAAIPLAPGDRWLFSLPLYHVGGIGVLMRCAIAGATIVIPDAKDSLADSLETYAPTHVSLVATQLYRLLRDEKSAVVLARGKAVLMGGGPTPESLVREAVARGIKLVMSYGMTETSAMICCTRPGDSIERLLSSGKPLVDGTMSISSDGEILVRGDQLFLGYLQPDGSVHRPLTEDGWFRTGDLGHFDDAGYLHVTGRRDNMFISGGENIQPEEIEAALRSIEGIEEAIVVPREDAEWGKRPVAFVRMDERVALDAEAMKKKLRTVLPGYKIPRAIYPWPVDLLQPGIKPARREFEKRAKELATDSTDLAD